MCGAPWGKLAKKASSADSCDSSRSRATVVSCGDLFLLLLLLEHGGTTLTNSDGVSSTVSFFDEEDDIDSLIERLIIYLKF